MRRTVGISLATGLVGLSAIAVALPSPPTSALPARSAVVTSVHGTRNPAHNVAAKPSFTTCYADRHTASCRTAEVKATDHARKKEHVRHLHLPTNFTALSPARQGFVLTDLERVDRGLPPFLGLVKSLNRAAKKGATHDGDPSLPSSFRNWTEWGSNWADDVNALAANYDWMYLDGYSRSGGGNLDCQSPHASGCWGHRDNILRRLTGTLVAGSATVSQHGRQSSAQLLVSMTGKHPPLIYTWRSAVRHGAGR